MKLDKELRELFEPFKQKGWKLENGKKHYKAISPTGRLVVISKTSSCPFYLKHVLGDLKRNDLS